MKYLKLFESFNSDDLKKSNNIFIDWFLKESAVDILKRYEIKKALSIAVRPPNIKNPNEWGRIHPWRPRFLKKNLIQRFKDLSLSSPFQIGGYTYPWRVYPEKEVMLWYYTDYAAGGVSQIKTWSTSTMNEICFEPVKKLSTYSTELNWLCKFSFTEPVEDGKYRISKDFLRLFSFHLFSELAYKFQESPDQRRRKEEKFFEEFSHKLPKIITDFIKNI